MDVPARTTSAPPRSFSPTDDTAVSAQMSAPAAALAREQRLRVGKRDLRGDHLLQRPLAVGLLRHPARERERGPVRPRAGADPRDAESLEVAQRRRAGNGEDADRAVDALDERR